MKILLVEDHLPEVELLRARLEEAGYDHAFDLTHVETLQAALDRLAHQEINGEDAFQAALLDLTLPDSQGLASLAAMRSQAPDLPIVVITSQEDERICRDAVREGAQDFLTKGASLNNIQVLVRSLRYAVDRGRAFNELRERNEALANSQASFRSVVEQNIDGILVIDDAGRVCFANRSIQTMFGDRAPQAGEHFGFPLTRGESTELDVLVSQGERRVFEMRVNETDWRGEKAFLASLRDITARKSDEVRLTRYQEHLEAQNRQLAAYQRELETARDSYSELYDFAPVGYFTLGLATDITQVNQVGASLLGLPRTRLVGERFREHILEGDRNLFDAYLKKLNLSGEHPVCQIRLLNEQRGSFWARLEGQAHGSDHAAGERIRLIVSDISKQKSLEEEHQQLLNTLRETLQVAETTNNELHEEIAKHKRTAEKLSVAKRDAEAASALKSNFLAHMSHEIRTPLSAIIGMEELLAESPLDSEQRRYLHVAHRASQVLMALVNDVLDLTKIEAGELVLDTTPFDLGELVRDTIDVLSLQARDKGIRLEWEIEVETPPRVRGDQQRLRQVLLNLIGNAIKFTESGFVRLWVGKGEEEGDHVRFVVSDSGIGISQEKLETIFQPFTQADAYTTRRYGGTGLGLTICRRLTDAMNGHIHAQSRPGKGARFQVTLPLPEIAHHEPEGLGGDLEETKGGTRKRPEATGGNHILLVDDSKDNLLLFKTFLGKGGYQVDWAENGEEAVALFKSQSYDLVLMDMQMPIMDGYTATRVIRAWEKETGRQPRPILALTAHALKEDVGRAMEAGCDRHLIKPITKARLLSEVAATLS